MPCSSLDYSATEAWLSGNGWTCIPKKKHKDQVKLVRFSEMNDSKIWF